jgi:hypothetical protein
MVISMGFLDQVDGLAEALAEAEGAALGVAVVVVVAGAVVVVELPPLVLL